MADDERISLSRAARLPELRINGTNPHVATIWRWATSGVRGVKLRTWKVGGRSYTTPFAVREFLAALNGGSPRIDTSEQTERANAACAAAGY
jgi:hypothetical protein